MAFVLENSDEEVNDNKFELETEEPKNFGQRFEQAGLRSLREGSLSPFLEANLGKEANIGAKNIINSAFNNVLRSLGGGYGGPAGLEEPNAETLDDFLNKLGKGKFIPETEQQEKIANIGSTIGDFLGIDLVTPGASILEKGIKGISDTVKTGLLFGGGEEVAKDLGFGKTGQFISGIFSASSPQLLKGGYKALKAGIEIGKDIFSSKKIPTGVPKFLEETGEKALADLELSSRDLTGRVAKTSEEMLSKFDESINT